MTEATLDTTRPPITTSRLIGSYQGSQAGSLLLCVGGIHGNETAGVEAARRVLERLRERAPDFSGRFVALAGNLSALALGRRFVDLDLNRQWLHTRVENLGKDGGADSEPVENGEQRELLDVLHTELEGATRPAVFLDMHTSSAHGAPFTTVGDTLRNREFALGLGLPIVLGLEEQIDGSLLEYLNNLGHITAGVEAGKHDAPTSVAHHESVLWLALVAAGHISAAAADAALHRRRLQQATPGVPTVVEVRHRHVISKQDRFVMRPGYSNFDPVPAGTAIADDIRGAVRTTERCRLLLPLYQPQGDDGFFTVREVRRFWLHVSRLLRRLGIWRLVTWLPGVGPHPEQAETVVVNTRIARMLPLQFFHLLGFRKRRWTGSILMVSRRRHDVLPGHQVHVVPPDA